MLSFRIILLVVFVFIGNIINPQNSNKKYLVTYLEKKIASEEQLKKINSYPSLIKERFLKQINKGEEKFLFIDDDMSMYSLAKTIEKEKVDFSNPDPNIERTTHLVITNYYKKTNDSFLIIKKEIKDDTYVIKADLHPFAWRLIDETKLIKSMKCKKAITIDAENGNEIEAWYTEEIPVSNGPSIYGGLPGLIIQLKTKSHFFEIRNIEETNTEGKIDFPSTQNSITMKDFKKKFNPENNKH